MNVASVWLQRYGKRAKERPQIWNAQKERQRAKGTGQKVIETAAKAAKDKSAPRLTVASAHKKNMRLNIDYTRKIRHAQI